MTTIYSPNNIEILLHCHTTPGPHKRIDAPAVRKAIADLLDEGAITADLANGRTDCYRTTEKGRAWVAALCAVPAPVQCWKDGATGKLIEP